MSGPAEKLSGCFYIRCDLCHQFIDRGEFTFVTQALEKFDADMLAVDHFIKIEQVGFQQQFLFIKYRARPEVGDPQVRHIVCPFYTHGKHAPQWNMALAEIDIRRGKPQLATPFGAVHHAPADTEITAQQQLRLLKAALMQPRTDNAAADAVTVKPVGFGKDDVETQLPAVIP